MNKFPQVVLIYDRRKQSSPTKEAMIEIRVTYGYKQKYISTGIKVLPKHWKNNKISGRQDSLTLNKAIERMTIDIKNELTVMSEKGEIDIFALGKDNSKSTLSFIDYCISKIEIKKFGKREDTQKRYDRFLKDFLSWGLITKFKDVTENSIIAYDKYLESKDIKNVSKWHNYHRFLNSFIIDAINDGYIVKNPYKNLNIDKNSDCDSLEKHLTPQEFKRFISVKMFSESLERVQDLFIFQTYTCMSYSDMKAFDASKIIHSNIPLYKGKRIKTGQQFIIPILSEAWKILKKYNYKLPIISNVKYNYYLKVVAHSAKIDKPVSSHWARHTGATLLLNEKNLSISIVAKILGHSSTKMTEKIYAKLLDESIIKAFSDKDKS